VVSYIGKNISANSLALNLDENGATIKYSLAGNAAETTIRIIDEDGNTVRTLEGSTNAGVHEITWDGKNSAGTQMEEGVYGFLVVAKDADGEAVTTAQGIIGKVTGVEIDNGTVVLSLGELLIPLDEVVSIQEAADADS
jgi:flagellar basal-body rod modification protein FlgD